MIPYLEAPVWQVAGQTIRFFGLMVNAALLTGFIVVGWRARHSLVKPAQAIEATLWVVIGSLVMSHLVAVLAYDPAAFARDPAILLDMTGDMSNIGGIVGGILCILLCQRVYGWQSLQLRSYFDVVTWGFVCGHFFGRLGCALAHDHIGVSSNALLAVAFPGGARWDLGLLEWLWINVCIISFLLWSRQPRVPGFYTLTFLFAHGIVRFLLDFLRADDIRYFGLTPAQHACVVLVMASAAVAWRLGLLTLPRRNQVPRGSGT